MKDKRLHTFRRTPDPDYTETLLQQLEGIPQTAVAPPAQAGNGRSRKMRLSWAIATLLLMFALMAMVPAVRARFEDVLRQIGQMNVFMTEDYPGIDDPNIVPNEYMSLAEARRQVDFEFGLPTWIPEGLVMQEEIVLNDVINGLRVQWLSEETRGRSLNLTIGRAYPEANFVVGPDSVTEVTINDVPAMLIHGGWYGDEKAWKDDGSAALRWQTGDIVYYLSTGIQEFGGLSDEELIQIAESISIP